MMIFFLVLAVFATTAARSSIAGEFEQQRGLRRVDDLFSRDGRWSNSQVRKISSTPSVPSTAVTRTRIDSRMHRNFEPQKSPFSTPILEQTQSSPHTSFSRSTFMMIWVLVLLYIIFVAIFITSRKAQTYLIYLHWIQPPTRWFPLTDLQSQRLSHTGRNINAGGLRGWHLVPPGPPFPPLFTSADAKEDYYERRLSIPRQRVVIFFHGNCGTRAFPPKRVHILKLLNAQLDAHVVTFDYSGFADSIRDNAPCENTFLHDACEIVRWVRARVHPTSSVYLYGQSLGTFAASHAAAHFSAAASETTETPTTSADFSCDGTYDFHVNNGHTNDRLVDDGGMNLSLDGSVKQVITGVVLDAPPASLQTAAQTHPILLGFRVLGLGPLFKSVIREKLDSTRAVARARYPLLVMHGGKDTMIPAWQGKLLADTATAGGNRRVTYMEFSNVGHVDVSGAEGYLVTLYNFIKQCESDSHQGPTTSK